jgi:holo-[acyl-carrier protein] synthase
MIRGIGVDIIEISRIADTIERSGDAFLGRIYTPREITYCSGRPRSAQHFAARFAAKEALSKALSTGWAGEFHWKDAEVVNDPSGQPRVELHNRLTEALARCAVHVSLSHSESHVVAMVLIEEHTP